MMVTRTASSDMTTGDRHYHGRRRKVPTLISAVVLLVSVHGCSSNNNNNNNDGSLFVSGFTVPTTTATTRKAPSLTPTSSTPARSLLFPLIPPLVSTVVDSSVQTSSSALLARGNNNNNNDDDIYRYYSGDDTRWHKRFWRRFRTRPSFFFFSGLTWETPVRTSLIVSNIAMYLYQVMDTTRFIHRRYTPPSSTTGLPFQYSLSVLADTLSGSAVFGPLTEFFAAVSNRYTMQIQPHRFLSSGFLHADLLHLLLNMDALRRTPDWLETGLGWPLFLSTFLISIVAGSWAFLRLGLTETVSVGASGGICGLYGLFFVSLSKMGNRRTSLRVLRGMALLFVFGALSEDISNAGHIGGFLAGAVMGILYGPSYRPSYSMRRKNSLEYDPAPNDYRAAMGYGVEATSRGLLPLWTLGVPILVAALSKRTIRNIPKALLDGLVQPLLV